MVPKLYHLVFRTILANIHSVPTLEGMPEVKEPTSTDQSGQLLLRACCMAHTQSERVQ